MMFYRSLTQQLNQWKPGLTASNWQNSCICFSTFDSWALNFCRSMNSSITLSLSMGLICTYDATEVESFSNISLMILLITIYLVRLSLSLRPLSWRLELRCWGVRVVLQQSEWEAWWGGSWAQLGELAKYWPGLMREYIANFIENNKKMQVQYRNSIYIGVFEDYQRNGFGQLLMDNSQLLVAKWKADKINGPYTLLTDHIRGFGNMNNNKLEGYNVLSVRASPISQKSQQDRTIYGMFKENRLYGKALIIQKEEVILGHFVAGELRQISDRKPIRERNVVSLLEALFPNQPYSMEETLNLIFKEGYKEISADAFAKYLPKLDVFEDGLSIFGFSEVSQQNKWVGLTMFQGEIITIGQHEGESLQGLGRVYKSETVEDGVFRKGELEGIGIKFMKRSNKYVLGEHGGESSDAFEKGFGFPHKEVSEIRKQFHLRSINFYNDIVLLSYSTQFQAILQNCSHLSVEESPRFMASATQNSKKSLGRGFSNKSPIRAKLAKDEQESDNIEEPSPVRQKFINQNQRADRKSKYFESDVDEDSRSRQGKKEENPRNRGNLGRPQAEDNKSTGKRKVKDTKKLVQELDTRERTRRDFLQKIYQEAGLAPKNK